jgi:hypothetical protein
MFGGGSTSNEAGIRVTGNSFTDQKSSPVYLKYQDAPVVFNNRMIHSAPIGAKYVGLFLEGCTGTDSLGLIANNVISFNSNQLSAGIVLSGTYSQRVYFNSVNIYGSTDDSRCFDQEGGGSSNVLTNNIFSNRSGGPVIYTTEPDSYSSDYNDFFSASERFIYSNGFINDLASWQSGQNKDLHSYSTDPYFVSDSDLHPLNPILNGTGMPVGAVTTDAEGVLRNLTNPDIGAYEFFSLGKDSVICRETELVLNAGPGYDYYEWNTADTTQQITAVYTDESSVWYSVTVQSESFSFTDSLLITFTGPEIELGPDTTGFCSGGSVILDAGAGHSAYVWSNGSTSQSVTLSEPGNYSLTVTDSIGCEDTDQVVVRELQLPEVNFINEEYLCENDSMLLALDTECADYTWSDQSSEASLMICEGGTYSVSVTDVNGCEGSGTIIITARSVPVVDLGTDLESCAGADITLDAGSGYISYCWCDSSTSQTLTINKSGEYYVQVSDSYHCPGSDTIQVIINPLPVVTITLVDGDLQADFLNAFSYEWYRNGILLPVANSRFYTPALPGEYHVRVTDTKGCAGESTAYAFSETGFSESGGSRVIGVYPNPTMELLHLDLMNITGPVEILIFDSQGAKTYVSKLEMKIPDSIVTIDLNGFEKGFYILSVISGDKISQVKFILE